MLICLDMRTGAGCAREMVDSARFCEHCGQNLRFALMLHDVGTLVGAYRVVRVIGYGGFGAIYEALGTAGEPVALKETFDTSSIKTFAREFAVLSQLKHVNLPRYIEMFEAQGNGYLVMEYVLGQSLQDILDEQAAQATQHEHLPESQVLGYALQLCDVLSYLHSQVPPIVHRDVKPANIRLTPQGRIKLVDFGLLKQGGYQTRATIRGLGTPAYAPIEQYAHDERATNPQSDLYSLAATLYHLLSGKEPPSAPNRLTNSEVLPPLPAKLSPHLKDAIIKAMSVMPKERFADMQAFKQALQGAKSTNEKATKSLINQVERQKVRETPTLEQHSLLSKATAWVAQTFTQRQSGYVMPSSNKSLPHLPLQTSGHILKVQFHSDGAQQTLIGMTKTGIIYQWRVPDGQLLKILSLAVFGEVEAIVYSPTGETVATVSTDYIIRIWRTQDGQLLHKLRGHGGLVKTLAYAPTGDVLVSGSAHDKFICFWHVATGKLLQKMDENKPIHKLAFSPDGTHLISSQYANGYVWHLANKKLLHTFKQGCTGASYIEWVGNRLAYGRTQAVVLQDAVTGEVIDTFKYEDTYFMGVALHPNGQQVAAGNSKGQLLIFVKGKSKPIYLCEAHKNRILSLAYTPDGRFLASGGQDQNVHLWALDTAHLPAITSSEDIIPEVIESPSLNKNEKLPATLSSALFQQTTEVEQLSNYVPATHELDLPHLVCDASGEVRTVGYHADGKELLAITNEGILYRWRVEDGQLIKKQALLSGQTMLTCAVISPDGQTVAAASENLMVFIWRLKDGKLLHQLRGHTDEIKALAYAPDAQILASSGGKDETIRFWGIANGKLLHMLKTKREILSLQFSPNSNYLACGSLHRVHIWGTRDKRWRKEIQKGAYPENNISWSPNGQFLLSGSTHNIYVWRVVDGQEMICFKGHENSIKAVAWHPNGQLALSTSYDRTVRIWSPLAPHLRHATKAHKKSIRCVAVSPDGRTFASGCEDGTVRLWFLADNLDKSLYYPSSHASSTDQSFGNTLNTSISEQPVGVPSTTSLAQHTEPIWQTNEPSVLRKLSRWITRQLSD